MNAPSGHSAYDLPFGLHYDMHAAIKALRSSKAMQETLGTEFVDLYCEVKEDECSDFEQIVTPWEREVLLLNV